MGPVCEVRSPCPGHICEDICEEPGYFCTCLNGYKGKTCESMLTLNCISTNTFFLFLKQIRCKHSVQ